MTTIRQLQYFVEVAERAHFGHAATALSVSQSALSQQLRSLELALGVTLIERNTRSAELTPTGRELLVQAKAVLLQMQDFADLAARATDRPVGRIRFGITPTLGPYLMPNVIADLHRQSPDLRLFIKEGIPAQQMTELAEGKLDMLVAPLPVRGDTFEVEPLFRETLHVVAPPDHPLATLVTLSEKAFAGHTFLSLDHRHHLHNQVQNICDRVGANILEDYEGTSLDSLRQMAGSGVGLAILPDLYVRSESGGTEMVKKLRPSDWTEYRSIVALWRRSSAFDSVYRSIANLVTHHAKILMKD